MKKTNEELFIQHQQESNTYKKEQIANELFSQNEKFIHHIAKGFRTSRLPYDEVANLATIGMVKAFRTYKPEHSKFITYASRLMTNEILMEIRKVEYKKDMISIETPTAENLTLGDMIKDKGVNFEMTLEQKDTIKSIIEYSSIALSKKEYLILMNELSDEPKKQSELGAELNCSQSYVSRLQNKVIANIRSFLMEAKAM